MQVLGLSALIWAIENEKRTMLLTAEVRYTGETVRYTGETVISWAGRSQHAWCVCISWNETFVQLACKRALREPWLNGLVLVDQETNHLKGFRHTVRKSGRSCGNAWNSKTEQLLVLLIWFDFAHLCNSDNWQRFPGCEKERRRVLSRPVSVWKCIYSCQGPSCGKLG